MWRFDIEPFVAVEADFARMKVTLTAGDILYIPPYWAHTVVAEGESVSVNVWSESSGSPRLYSLFIPLANVALSVESIRSHFPPAPLLSLIEVWCSRGRRQNFDGIYRIAL